jgi:hypothetical protein
MQQVKDEFRALNPKAQREAMGQALHSFMDNRPLLSPIGQEVGRSSTAVLIGPALLLSASMWTYRRPARRWSSASRAVPTWTNRPRDSCWPRWMTRTAILHRPAR